MFCTSFAAGAQQLCLCKPPMTNIVQIMLGHCKTQCKFAGDVGKEWTGSDEINKEQQMYHMQSRIQRTCGTNSMVHMETNLFYIAF